MRGLVVCPYVDIAGAVVHRNAFALAQRFACGIDPGGWYHNQSLAVVVEVKEDTNDSVADTFGSR